MAALDDARELLVKIMQAELKGLCHPRRDMQRILIAYIALAKEHGEKAGSDEASG
jgi:hypothetical protein